MQNKALLIIDVQMAMFSYDFPLYKGKEVLSNIKNILETARKIEMPVVFIQHTENEEYTKGTPTWDICREVSPLPNEHIVEKSFCDSFQETKLQEVLQSLDIKNLIIMGMQSEFCIDTSCRRAFSLGYNNFLVSDAHSTFDSDTLSAEQIVNHENRVLGGKPEGRFVKLKTTDEIIEIINQ